MRKFLSFMGLVGCLALLLFLGWQEEWFSSSKKQRGTNQDSATDSTLQAAFTKGGKSPDSDTSAHRETPGDGGYARVQQGATFGRPLIGGAFNLVDQWGHKRTDKDFRGRWLLVYFGYTFCPDICPMALENMGEALKKLGPQAKDIHIVFITVDPRRDTIETLKSFLENYDSRIVGLTGTEAQIQAALSAYRVYALRAEDETGHANDDRNYLIDHSSLIYIMSPRGDYVKALNHETPPEEIVYTLKELL